VKGSRPFRVSIRNRLTLVYGGLFLLAGLALLGVTYFLASANLLNDPMVPAVRAGVPKDARTDLPEAIKQIREGALDELLSQGAIALALVSAIAVVLGWLVAGRLLQPLHRITGTARRIAHAPAADSRLGERIALDGPRDELKELADTFDLMLERLDHSFDGQRQFIANASHELRTPLTLNRTLIEVAMDPETAPPQTLQLGATLLAINAQHERLIEGLLLLARSGEVAKQSYVDLADVADHVVSQTSSDAVTIRAELAEAPTTGDSVLLERLVQNLIDNSVKHNIADDGWVHVSTGTRPDGTVALEVSNTGPVIPRYEVPRLFEPFHRLSGDRHTAPGAGLGLSVVQSVVHAHNGVIHTEPRSEGGLVITVVLPATT
jgi:signal transduction histidine kinase